MLSMESGETERGDVTESLHTSLLSVPFTLKVMGSHNKTNSCAECSCLSLYRVEGRLEKLDQMKHRMA